MNGLVSSHELEDSTRSSPAAAAASARRSPRRSSRAGARVTLMGRDARASRLRSATSSPTIGEVQAASAVDVTQPEAVAPAFAGAAAAFGAVDILVNNAGQARGVAIHARPIWRCGNACSM